MNNLTYPFSWDDLRVLLAVLQARSLSRAAAELQLSQPTVSRRLAALEQILGGPLVERGPLGCRPTERGAALAPLIESMRQAADGIHHAARAVQLDASGVVRVAAGDLIGRHIARRLPELVAGARGLSIELVTGLDETNLNRGEVEIALRNRRPRRGPLYARGLQRTPFAVYGASAYVATRPVAWDPEERFSACDWVGHSSRRLGSVKWLDERLSPEAIVQRFSSSLMVLEAIAAGAGLGLLPTFAGDDDPRLVRLSEPLPDLGYQGWLVTHRKTRELPRVRLVAERLFRLLGPGEG